MAKLPCRVVSDHVFTHARHQAQLATILRIPEDQVRVVDAQHLGLGTVAVAPLNRHFSMDVMEKIYAQVNRSVFDDVIRSLKTEESETQRPKKGLCVQADSTVPLWILFTSLDGDKLWKEDLQQIRNSGWSVVRDPSCMQTYCILWEPVETVRPEGLLNMSTSHEVIRAVRGQAILKGMALEAESVTVTVPSVGVVDGSLPSSVQTVVSAGIPVPDRSPDASETASVCSETGGTPQSTPLLRGKILDKGDGLSAILVNREDFPGEEEFDAFLRQSGCIRYTPYYNSPRSLFFVIIEGNLDMETAETPSATNMPNAIRVARGCREEGYQFPSRHQRSGNYERRILTRKKNQLVEAQPEARSAQAHVVTGKLLNQAGWKLVITRDQPELWDDFLHRVGAERVSLFKTSRNLIEGKQVHAFLVRKEDESRILPGFEFDTYLESISAQFCAAHHLHLTVETSIRLGRNISFPTRADVPMGNPLRIHPSSMRASQENLPRDAAQVPASEPEAAPDALAETVSDESSTTAPALTGSNTDPSGSGLKERATAYLAARIDRALAAGLEPARALEICLAAGKDPTGSLTVCLAAGLDLSRALEIIQGAGIEMPRILFNRMLLDNPELLDKFENSNPGLWLETILDLIDSASE